MSDSPPPPPDPSLDALIARARAADGQPPFSDGALVHVRTGERELVWLDGLAAAIVPVGSGGDTGTGVPAGASGSAVAEVEFVVHPDARGRGLGTALLERLQARSPAGLLVWAHGDHPAARALAASHGLEPVRELWHMSSRVGEGSASPVGSDNAPVDSFRPGDEDAWLALNARAFAGHPEQGRLTRAELDVMMSEPWFSAEDLLLARADASGGPREGASGGARGTGPGRRPAELVGYCWLKVDGGRGEFYAVGIAPERQGEGWGRRLTEAGLARLASRGIRSAHLYVEGDNEPAIRLYRSLGFERDGTDVQYRWAGATA